MLEADETGAVDALAAASQARRQVIYQRHAVALHRQALLMLGDSALAEDIGCDVIADECVLVPAQEPSEHETRHRLAQSVDRRCQQYVQAGIMLGIGPYDMAALLRGITRRRRPGAVHSGINRHQCSGTVVTDPLQSRRTSCGHSDTSRPSPWPPPEPGLGCWRSSQYRTPGGTWRSGRCDSASGSLATVLAPVEQQCDGAGK